jgi:hypothetical protein
MLKRKIGLITLLAGLSTSPLFADNTLTNFTTGDVLICFRAGSGQDLVVDAGPINTFLGYAQGSTNTITAFTPSQLSVIGLNAAAWQVFAWKSDNSLYITRPRTGDINSQSAPYHNQTGVQQNQIAGRMAYVPSGAAYSYLPPNTYDANSTAASVIESDDDSTYYYGKSYGNAYNGATKGRWNNLFQSNAENNLSGSFTTSGKAARADLYVLTPDPTASSDSTYLGYFELAPNGTMTYVAYPASRPTVQSFARSGNSTTITYTAGLYGTYTLMGSASLTSPSWTSLGTLPAGDTAIHTTNFTDTATVHFYKIQGQ